MQCVMQNTTDIAKCQFYVDMLNECKKTSETGSTPTTLNTNTLNMIDLGLWREYVGLAMNKISHFNTHRVVDKVGFTVIIQLFVV